MSLKRRPDVVSVSQAAQICRVSASTIRKCCETGRLPCHMVGTNPDMPHRRIRTTDLAVFMRDQGLPLAWLDQYLVSTTPR